MKPVRCMLPTTAFMAPERSMRSYARDAHPVGSVHGGAADAQGGSAQRGRRGCPSIWLGRSAPGYDMRQSARSPMWCRKS